MKLKNTNIFNGMYEVPLHVSAETHLNSEEHLTLWIWKHISVAYIQSDTETDEGSSTSPQPHHRGGRVCITWYLQVLPNPLERMSRWGDPFGGRERETGWKNKHKQSRGSWGEGWAVCAFLAATVWPWPGMPRPASQCWVGDSPSRLQDLDWFNEKWKCHSGQTRT